MAIWFNAAEFWNRLFSGVVTIIPAIVVAEWARRQGLLGQQKWDAEKAKFEILKEQQFKRMKSLERVLELTGSELVDTITFVAVDVINRRKLGPAWKEEMGEVGFNPKEYAEAFEATFSEIRAECRSYGYPPSGILPDGRALEWVRGDLYNRLQLRLRKEDDPPVPGAIVAWDMVCYVEEFRQLVAYILDCEEKILFEGPGGALNVKRGRYGLRSSRELVDKMLKERQEKKAN